MAKYPISHNGNKQLGLYFKEIMILHIPPSKDKSILDPTCGKKRLWSEMEMKDVHGISTLDRYNKVIFSDLVDYGQELVSNIDDLSFDTKFDGIIYDPPYFFGYKGSSDPRRKDYGDYMQTYGNLLGFMDVANTRFPEWLKDDGKLIVKCADQYQTKERKFYAHHNTWINRLENFEITDLNIFIHHRMSPTAFQVKNRPCSVIMHTFFLTFNKRN